MKKNIVIADLDGTIADCEHRRNFVTGKNKDWQKFYAACIDDEPNVPVINTLRALKAQGYQIIILYDEHPTEFYCSPCMEKFP